MKHTTYTVTAEPTEEPITLAQLKTRLRVTVTEFDTELTELLTAARKQLEHDTNRRFVTQTIDIESDSFPSGDVLELRQAPISAVTSISYTDTAGDVQTFAASNYTTDLRSTPPRVQVAETTSWPATDDVPNAVKVTVTAGYGAAAAVPVEAKLAIVEWCKMHWGDSDGNATKYQNLRNKLAWSGCWKAM